MLSPEFSPELTIVPSDGIRQRLYAQRMSLVACNEALAPLTEHLAIDPLNTDLLVTIGDANETADAFTPPPELPERPGRPAGERLDIRVYEFTEENILANFAAGLMRRDDIRQGPRRIKRAFYWGGTLLLTELSVGGTVAEYTGSVWGCIGGAGAAALTLLGVHRYLKGPYTAPPHDLRGIESPIKLEPIKEDYLDEAHFFKE